VGEEEKMKEAMMMEPKNENWPVRGNVFEGVVTSAKAPKTVTVRRDLVHFVSKYERYKKSSSKLKAHVPESMTVKEGDVVRIGETRKISKTKNFIVLEVLKKGEAKRSVEETSDEKKKPKKHEEAGQ
jgi:small subunit ribosomal protein S17